MFGCYGENVNLEQSAGLRAEGREDGSWESAVSQEWGWAPGRRPESSQGLAMRGVLPLGDSPAQVPQLVHRGRCEERRGSDRSSKGVVPAWRALRRLEKGREPARRAAWASPDLIQDADSLCPLLPPLKVAPGGLGGACTF